MPLKIFSRLITVASNTRSPLIKFRYGLLAKQLQATQEVTKTAEQHNDGEQLIYTYELPLRFQRQLISEEEINCINLGGAIDGKA